MIRPRYWLTAAAAVCLLWASAYTVQAVITATTGSP